jgi:hypothetical protein
MNKLFFLVALSFSSHFAKTQTLPVNLKNALQDYFLTLPPTNDFKGWITSIENDSTMKIDTTILHPAVDSFYFYLRCASTSFISPISGASYKMVIMARNRNLPSNNTISMIAQMEYYLDTSANSEIRIEKTYKELDKKFRRYFAKNIERKNEKKNAEHAVNNYYLKDEHTPVFVMGRGRYYDGNGYCITITLNYTLSNFKNISL